MQRTIMLYGKDVLRAKAEPVARVDDGIRALARDMLETMYAANGLGLAAEQIGRTEAVVVIDVPEKADMSAETGLRQNPNVKMPLVLINPEISEPTGSETRDEGCLSFPEIFVPVRRAKEVRVVFQDLRGERRDLRVAGLLARAVQHELDHLNGKLLVDRMSAVSKISHAGRLKRLKKESQAG